MKMTERILTMRCNKCGNHRDFIWRSGLITKKYRKCFYCGKNVRLHTHINKQSQIVQRI